METEAIYKSYPRQKDKIHALRSIEKALRRIMSGETGRKMSEMDAVTYLLERTTAFANSPAGQRGYLTPYPATWMNRGGYMDEPSEWDYLTIDEYKQAMSSREANVGVWKPS